MGKKRSNHHLSRMHPFAVHDHERMLLTGRTALVLDASICLKGLPS
jgi:hypothetical protein